MNESTELRMTKLALKVFHEHGITTMAQDELSCYLTAVAQGGYQLLRSVEGDEFVRGWLESALADLANPPLIAFATRQ